MRVILTLAVLLTLASTGCIPDTWDQLIEQTVGGEGGEGTCRMYCEDGFKTDVDGNDICECRDPDCEEAPSAAPPIVRDPETGACREFASWCDVPDGWEECVGCVDGTGQYEVGDQWTAEDGCSTCKCVADGEHTCDVQECPVTCELEGTLYLPGESHAAECSECTCQDSGEWDCVQNDLCPDVLCLYEGSEYAPGESFPAGDGCSTCTCQPDGDVICTQGDCIATCEYEGETHLAGDSFPAGDGCNECACQEDGSVVCTLAQCAALPSCDPVGAMECDALVPECPPGLTAVFDNGCPTGECVALAECAEGYSCTPGDVVCDAEPPDCGEDGVAVFLNDCWGPCLPAQACLELTDCNWTTVVCAVPPPLCEPGTVAEVVDGCWGDCVPTEWCPDGAED